jgi:hypothetical protein
LPKHKSATVSLRISDLALKALQEESKKMNVSMNTLANQILLSFATYDRYLSRFGMVKVGVPTLRRIIAAGTDSEIAEAGRYAGMSLPPSFILNMRGKLTLDSVIEYLEIMGRYANMFDYSEASQGGQTTITLVHDFGEKGSLFLEKYVEGMFERLGEKIKILRYPDSITIEVTQASRLLDKHRLDATENMKFLAHETVH